MEAISRYLSALGYEPELSKMYVALMMGGPQTVSELARSSGVERTRVYRLSERMAGSGLFEMQHLYRRNIYSAAPLGNLKAVIVQKTSELGALSAQIEETERHLANPTQLPGTKVKYYQGTRGVKQMLWNQTRSQSEVLCILEKSMQSDTKAVFFEYWVRTCNDRSIRFRALVNDSFVVSQGDWDAKHSNEHLTGWQSRHVAKEAMKISNNQIMYDDVVAFYQWKNNDVSGVEIISADISAMQRSLFEVIWAQA